MDIPQKRLYPALPFQAKLHVGLFKEPDFLKKDTKEVEKSLTTETQLDPNERILNKWQQSLKALNTEITKQETTNENLMQKKMFERHTAGCVNEHESFNTLRQVYPNKHVEGLWDLFVKCNGDVDWCADLLMQEAESVYFCQAAENSLAVDKFVCNCNGLKRAPAKVEKMETSTPNAMPFGGAMPKRKQKSRNNNSKPKAEEVKKTVENWFQLADKPKNKEDFKFSLDFPKLESQPTQQSQKPPPQQQQQELEEEYEKDFVKLTFGQQLIEQLKNYFQNELSFSNIIPNNFKRNVEVSLPREMAQELFLLYVESVYNNMEDENAEQETAMELAKNQQTLDTVAPTKDKMEQVEAWKEPLNDLATICTLHKLYDEYPGIPPETLDDIFAASDNNYQSTVQLLQEFQVIEDTNNMALKERTATERNSAEQTPRRKAAAQTNMDEQKRRAIMEFEETRNSAAHYSRLKFECFKKAKEAIQQGNHGAALYYSEVSRMHDDKIDQYNHQAANCIMNVHKLTTNNPDLLDLHYLHLSEAVVCLDIFLDRHLAALQTLKRPYKNIFIITGRGLHSAMGVSTIKGHVKARMRERNMR